MKDHEISQSRTPSPAAFSSDTSGGEDRSVPRALFLCQTLPFPPDGGVNIRAFHLLRILASRYKVTALCFYRQATRPGEHLVAESIAGLEAFADVVEAYPIPHEQSPLRFIIDHTRSVLTRRVYTVFAYDSKQFRARLRHLLSTQCFDFVHVDSLDLSTYLRDLDDQSVILGHHNIESVLLHRRSEQEEGWIRQAYVGHQARLMAREESRWCDRVALNLVVSEDDRNQLLSQTPAAHACVVPNGVDTEAFRPQGSEEHGIVFVGGHTWFPNRDGMAYFAREILPHIRQERPEVEVTWVGRASDEVVRHYHDQHDIILTGYVPDVRPYLHRAACFIVPLRVGGGTRLKILDAWACGKAIVSTSRGCEGLDATDGDNILIRDDPEAFAAGVLAVLRRPDTRQRLGELGRKTAVSKYDWGVIGKHLLSNLATLSGP